MPQRLRHEDVARDLRTMGHQAAEHDPEHGWSPGYRTVQVGPHHVLVYWEGPGTSDEPIKELAAYLRMAGYGITERQQERDARRRLEITRP